MLVCLAVPQRASGFIHDHHFPRLTALLSYLNPAGRIVGFSNWRGSVRRQRSDCQLVGRSDVSMPVTSRLKRESTDGLRSDSRVVTLHRSTRHTNVARAPRV